MVHVVARDAPAKSIEDLDNADIEASYDHEVRAALDVLQRGRADGATRFVFVIPAIAERGASGYAATCAAAEAVRVLALSAARQWNDTGVTVNCLSAPWPYAASLDADIAPLVELCGAVNGETLRVGGPRQGV